MTESELASKIVKWLNDQHYEVYQEVAYRGNVADIVAVMNRRTWIIETKTSMSLAVMRQAHHWIPYSHWVSVGVPYNSGRGFAEIVCQKFGIGVIHVSMKYRAYDHSDVTETASPRLNRKALASNIRLVEEQKSYSMAGSPNGSHWSPFKQTCSSILRYVRNHPGCCLKELVENIEHHYASRSGAKQCISHWVKAGKVPGIRSEQDGRYLRFYGSEP